MNYIEKTLSKDEKILQYFNLNKWMYLGPIFQSIFSLVILIGGLLVLTGKMEITPEELEKFQYGILAAIGIGVIGILKSIYDFLLLGSIKMAITNKRIVYKSGIIARDTDEIRLSAVETVDVQQSVLGRLLGYGTVKVTGKGDSRIIFQDIEEPLNIKRDISSVISS
jgi:uncharacterized membrane protein YdbT with pleckstrin-like domain